MDIENIINEIDYYDDIDHYDDILWPDRVRLPKVYIRDAQDPFQTPIESFKKRFRFCQDSVIYITNLIRVHLQKVDNRGLPIAPEIAVLLTLRFYATASFQVSLLSNLTKSRTNTYFTLDIDCYGSGGSSTGNALASHVRDGCSIPVTYTYSIALR